MTWICGLDGCNAVRAGLTETIIPGDELEGLKRDAERFRWWFAPYDPSKSAFALRYIEGCTNGWSLDQWRWAIDEAMSTSTSGDQK